MAVLKEITKYIIYSVTFPVNEITSSKPIYFAHESDAKRCADLKRGWYGSNGRTYSKEFSKDKLPSYYEDFNDWAENTLTVKEYKALNL